jgi:hypothetical protein
MVASSVLSNRVNADEQIGDCQQPFERQYHASSTLAGWFDAIDI